MDQQQQAPCVPPGFRFHPTEEELVGYYLARKVASQKIDLDIIREVDLYRIEPWDLQERCGYYGGAGAGGGATEEEPSEYYFFSYKDRKYPSGTRTNRATAAGFWKATGRDKPVLSTSSPSRPGAVVGVIGMRKTLVFYRGRAPNGRKTDWIIHEYRLQSNEHAPTQEEGWVVCRAFQKPIPNHHQHHHHHHHQIRHHAAYYGYSSSGGNTIIPTSGNGYYYDGSPNSNNNATHQHAARLLMSSTAAAAAANEHHQSLLESKLQVQLIADMPPLQSPAAVVGQSYEQAAVESSTVDWNLLSSLLPSSQLNFHHQQQPPPASPSSCSAKNNNDDI
ncbi:hypothetical protein PR202_gb29078 [Eleusine coracana subsp. coracana]|uniref:NAC domain-containing protein n=1 Tax=Eleusine coracana subsp. coracana TaxID=191504 RepID=A0AAV5FWA4_ELECO|nr:hypothetical protein PR202_gb29078 [Eleusine coracana subsp. coracana]